MKKYNKKIALILVLALTLAIAIPALATDTVITGRYEDPDIEVVLPGNTSAIINPYGLPIALKADDGQTELGNLKDNQIFATKPLVGYSLCEVDLNIGASVIGEGAGDFRFVPEAPGDDSIMKTGQVYFEIKTVSDLGYTTTADTSANIGNLTGAKVLSELDGWGKTAYSNANNQLLVGLIAAKKTGMCTVKAAVDASGNKLSQPAANGYFIARLSGDVTTSPREAWLPTDGLNVTITWIVEPTPPASSTP